MALVYVHKNLSVKVMEFLKNECIAQKYSGSPENDNLNTTENLNSSQPSCLLFHGVNK